MLALVRAVVARWRRRRHPTPHRDPLVPRKRGWADGGYGPAAFMPPPSPRTSTPARARRRPPGDDVDPGGGAPVPAASHAHARWRPVTQP
jgi:hypothetical protein